MQMQGVEPLRQRRVARDFDREVAEIQLRAPLLNDHTALGSSVTEIIGQACPAMGELRRQPISATAPLKRHSPRAQCVS